VIGALIDIKAVEEVEAYIADALKRRQGRNRRQARCARRRLFKPTVLIDVTTDMVITKEKTFGQSPRSTASRPTMRPSRWPTTPPPFPRPRR
jgi:hypothetical protein